MGHLDAGVGLEQFAHDVREGAIAKRGVVHLAGIGAGVLHQLLDRLGRQRRRDGQHQLVKGKQPQWREVVEGVDRRFGVQMRQLAGGASDGVEHGVAIGRSTLELVDRDQGRAARTVVDHRHHTGLLRQPRTDQPCQLVGGATGRERAEDAQCLA